MVMCRSLNQSAVGSIIALCLVAMAFPSLGAAQSYSQITGTSQLYCISFSTGETKLTKLGQNGYEVVDFNAEKKKAQKKIKVINQKIEDLEERLEDTQGREAKQKVQRAIKNQKTIKASTKLTVTNITKCQQRVPLPAHSVAFTFAAFPFMNAGVLEYSVGAWLIVDEVKISLGHGSSLEWADDSNWCVSFSGTYQNGGYPLGAPQGSEIGLRFRSDQCHYGCPNFFGPGKIGYPFYVHQPIFDPAGAGPLLADAEAFVGTLSAVARPAGPEGCNPG